MGWKDDARRSILGEKTGLASFPGYTITPRKYSIEILDEIKDIERERQKEVDRRALARVAKKMAAKKQLSEEDLSKLTPAEMINELEDDEFAALFAAVDKSHGFEAKIISVKIRGGLGAHDFKDSSVEELSTELLEYAEIAGEVVRIIDEFNRPLVKSPSETSKQSPGGSTGGEDSSQTAKTSKTVETPGT